MSNKFDSLHADYLKALSYPQEKQAELEPQIATLREKVQSAKVAFNNAVNDGEDANTLYMQWKSAQDELGMKEAELEALAHMGIGKHVPLIAKQLEEEGHKEADTIQAEKVKLFDELEAIREQYLKVAYEIFQKQQRQGKLMQELDNVRRVVKGIEPISPNLFTPTASFPLITEGVVRQYNMDQAEG
jgi:DNA repair exonuclease SbcCD ATPase subunit